ncbi:MAG: RNA-binding S4 domain-containing protein [Saprospiraceae bacterium]|nr:RNA-binding S4 domain-containing protein [Saprospiraceae bacterium]
MSKTRIDKWLWSVRIFKSRTIATEHCKSGRVSVNDHKAKPSSMISAGEMVHVHKNGYQFTFEVLKIIEKRVSAPLAQEAYQDLTPEEELNKYENWFSGKARPEVRERGAGRPTKKERREIDSFKGDFILLTSEKG